MNPQAVAIVVSPLKHLQSTQAQEMKRFSIRPLVINRDVELSPTEIQVFRAKFSYLESTGVTDAEKGCI